MNELFRLYNDVFSKLPVSLVGYDDIENKINSFFYKIKSDSYFKEYDNIIFFSYSLSKLKNARNWETDLLSHEFFFDAYKKRNSLLTLSFYSYLKSEYSIKYNTITSLSELFAKDVSFRVSCTDNEKWNFYYDQSKNILSFEIPNCILKTNLYIDIERRFFKELIKRGTLENYYVKQHNSIYKRVDLSEIQEEIRNEHERFFQEGFNSNMIGTFDKNSGLYQKEGTLFYELYKELKYFTLLNPDLFVESTSTKLELIEEWISQLVSIAFLAGYYDCWIEYMPAVVGVFDLKKDGRIYKTEERNLGSFIIGYSKKNEISLDDRAVFKLISERVSLVVGGGHFIELIKENKKYATRAAISQVMARNMSHNIGSHVLSKMVSADYAKNKFPLNNQYISSNENIYTSLKPSTDDVPDFNLANFNSYLRTRMDFLADIATGEPSMETTCLLVRDIIGEMDKNRILLNSISGVENFNYTIKVKDCRECDDENCDKDDCYCNSNGKDIPVSIPNGIMGYHALYVIIENIIRNTAKHQENSLQDKNDGNSEEQTPKIKEFTIEIRTSKYDDTLYEVWLYDNISKSEVKQLTDDEKKFFKDKTSIDYDNSLNNKLDWLVFEQNTRLNNSVINSETSRLREGAWGLIEMDASSAYLRKLAPEKIDEDIYNIDLLDTSSRYNPQKTKLNILKAINKNGRLGYRFHLLKPKEMLIVDEKGELYKFLKEKMIDSKYKLDILRENGIWVLQTQDNKDANYFDIEKVYPHPFMLIVAGDNFNVNKYLFVNGDETDLFRGNLPNKIIACKKDIQEETKNPIPWVAYINQEHDLIKSIQNTNNLVREKIESLDDIQKDILMDLVWRVWLENKMAFHNVEIKNEEVAFEIKINTVLPYLTNSKRNPLLLFKLHHPNIQTLNEGLKRNSDFILGYSSSVKQYMDNSIFSRDPHNPQNPNILINKINSAILAESIFNKIILFDERIQSSWEAHYPDLEMKKLSFYEYSNMICPSKELIDLNISTYNSDYETKILGILKSYSKNKKISNIDFIVIHLGVIEKILIITKGSKKKEYVREFILKLQNHLNPSKARIIITSGRGKPDNLPKEVPFISFSTLSQYSIETPFKPFLNQIIQSARIFKNN